MDKQESVRQTCKKESNQQEGHLESRLGVWVRKTGLTEMVKHSKEHAQDLDEGDSDACDENRWQLDYSRLARKFVVVGFFWPAWTRKFHFFCAHGTRIRLCCGREFWDCASCCRKRAEWGFGDYGFQYWAQWVSGGSLSSGEWAQWVPPSL